MVKTALQIFRTRNIVLLKLIVLVGFVVGVLAFLLITTQTYVLVASLLGSLLLSLYLLITLRSHRGRARKVKRNFRFPFVIFFALLLVPIVISVLYSSQQFNSSSVYSIVVGFGMTLTFLYTMINVPLTIYHKSIENNAKLPEIIPLVTIIIPAYNEEKTIAKTLDSVIESDYPSKQVIVVDDGSTDRTYAIASTYKSKMPNGTFSIIRKENGGKSSAINYGIKFASGTYIISIDADSIMGRDAIKEIIKYFQQDNVVAVGGNIKVKNRNGVLTFCQALEYLVGINLFKRAYDVFGVVMVVPGPLGGFRKRILLERGEYDNDTLTEDFDTTLKALKTGKAVQASSYAISFTEAPETMTALYKQRIRWNRGNLQTLIKHKDIIMNNRYGLLQKYGYPLVFLTMVFLPFLSVIVVAFTVLALIEGQWFYILITFLVFVALEAILAAIAVIMDEEDWRLILFSPLLVIGYKHIIDIIIIKSVFDVLFRKNLKWTSAK